MKLANGLSQENGVAALQIAPSTLCSHVKGQVEEKWKKEQFRGILRGSDKEIVNILSAKEKGSKGAVNPFLQLSSTDCPSANKILWSLLHLIKKNIEFY